MRICLVSAFPPSGRQLNEYAFHIARELKNRPDVELIILADKLTNYEFVTDGNGSSLRADQQAELPGFNVKRVWKFGDPTNPVRLLKAVRRLKPDVVWFNLVYSSFGTPENPVAAFLGLVSPALLRAAGFYTHVTLHHILEHVDFEAAGVRHSGPFRIGTEMATRALLKVHSVSVLLSEYRRTLMTKYSARNVRLSTHGIFSSVPCAPDPSKRSNPDARILAIGHWGTYKRLETLMSAFPAVLQRVPNARLIIAGANHHTRAGYWESIREAQPAGLPIEFRGYVPEEAIPELFQTASLLVLPYDSATGSSGPAHQACEYGVPIVCADIPDLRGMSIDEGMAIRFYETGNAVDLAEQLIAILQSSELQQKMAEHNYAAGIEMSISTVVKNYLHWFKLDRWKHSRSQADRKWLLRGLWSRARRTGQASPESSVQASNFTSNSADMEIAHKLELVGRGPRHATLPVNTSRYGAETEWVHTHGDSSMPHQMPHIERLQQDMEM